MSELVTAKEAAKFLKLTTKTVYKLCAEGKLPSVRIGNTVRVDLSKINNQA